MDLFFENQSGMLHFKGAGRQNDGIFIKNITGLGVVDKEQKTVGYVNQPGQLLLSVRDRERVITLSVDICSCRNLQAAYRRLAEILYQPGQLRILSGTLYRKISCRCTAVSEPERQSKNILSVVLQFTCDHPYFTDVEAQSVMLFSRTDLVESSFTLPCVFTERTTGAVVVNQGCISAEPVFSIYNIGLVENAPEQLENYGILIQNLRTDQKLLLLYHTQPGEIITLDIPKRTITSNLAGNIIDSLSLDSFLSDFFLEPGENNLTIINQNTEENISILMTYENQYIEAVV